MTEPNSMVFLLDIDNTLLDNDRFAADLGDRLQQLCGVAGRARYWTLFAELRAQLGYADYLSAVQMLRAEREAQLELLELSVFLLNYPFAARLYPQALAVITHLKSLGQVAVLSDGDAIFQPQKIRHAGIWQALDGKVLIYLHKERMLDEVQRHYPAAHYVMVDDKPQLLATMKNIMGRTLTTVFVQQGHYAREADMNTIEPAPDLTINHIGDLLHYSADALLLTSGA